MEETVEWLVQEINDLLDVSSVGLYEFLELLDDPESPLSAVERREVARRALDRVLSDGAAHLQWMKWPQSDSHGSLSPSELPANPWRRPDDDGLYLAVNRP